MPRLNIFVGTRVIDEKQGEEKKVKDTRIREDVFPVRVVAQSGAIEGAESLVEPVDMQIGTSETRLVKISGKAHLVLDFGKEYNGGVRVLTHHAGGGSVKVRIRCGESVAECCAELGERGAGNHHTLRDAFVELPMLSDMTFFETGFRFVRMDFPEGTDMLLKAVTAVYVHRDLKPIGSFKCNDERVNEIFDIAARTLMLNMQRYIWDGIKRDRLVWVGDMHPETMGIISLFGSDESVLESLEYSRAHTPLPEWMNGIENYSMWWVIILADYYRHNGDAEYIKSQRDYIYGVMKQIGSLVSAEGKVTASGLFDWPSHEKPDEIIGTTALVYLAAQKGKELFALLGLDTAVCDEIIRKLEGFSDKAAECKQCEAMKVFAGLEKPEDAYAFLSNGNSRGMSTFMSYYILSAVAAAGKPEKAVEIMKEYYGAMLDKGATSFWENFDMDWVEGTSRIDEPVKPDEKDVHGDFGDYCYVGFRHSLCHGWSCGPVPFLIKTVGGIEPLEAGCKTLAVNPVSAGFNAYEIKYPTPFGTVDISLENGFFTVAYPAGVKPAVPSHRKDVKLKKK